jgi:type I restriction enzyme S subunit
MEGGELPENWVAITLEDVAEVHDNLREPVNSSERSKRAGPYPYFGATGRVGWIDDYRQDGEYVLLGEDGAPFFDPTKDKAYLVSGKCWVNNHAHVLKGIGGLCINRYR